MDSLTPTEGYGQECGYPMSPGMHPIRLDENRVLKTKLVDSGESHAMKFIAKATTIPIPKIFETGYIEKPRENLFYIIMEYIPGKPLDFIWKDLSDDQRANICRQIDGYLIQLRELTSNWVMAADGGALNVGLYQPRFLGPYKSVKEFHHSLAKGEPHDLGDDHVIHFAHADLAPRNIIVDEDTGRINAVIDWDRAGWYPEYWDYVRMHTDSPLKREMGGYTQLWKSYSTNTYEAECSAMIDLVGRTIPPYPDGKENVRRPTVLPSFASYASQLQEEDFEAKLNKSHAE